MKEYVKIMNDTVTSECCKIVHYVYRDNLVSTNSWVYGTNSQEQYQQDLLKLAEKSNLRSCSEYRPFVNRQSN